MSIVGTHTITIGDTLEPLDAILRDKNDNPIDLASYTVKFAMETESGTEELAETETGITKQPTQTFTVDTATYHVKAVAHGVKEGDEVIVASTVTLPTGLAASTRYFARDVSPNTFKLETVPGGGVLSITGAGSGTHTFYVVGSVQMDFAAANVDTAGTYRGWFVRISGSEKAHHPPGKDNYIQVVIETRGN